VYGMPYASAASSQIHYQQRLRCLIDYLTSLVDMIPVCKTLSECHRMHHNAAIPV